MKNSAILVSILAIVLVIGLMITGCKATSPTTITQTQTVTQAPVTVTATQTVTMAFTELTTPTPEEPFAQLLSCTLESSTQRTGFSIANYVKYLHAGDQVTGVVQLTGTWEWDEQGWVFFIFYRGDNDEAKSIFQNWQSSPLGGDKQEDKHAFAFTAQQDGEYTLRITVESSTSKELRLEVEPGGWR